MNVNVCEYKVGINAIRGFPKVDHSGIDARIVLEPRNSAKKTSSKRT